MAHEALVAGPFASGTFTAPFSMKIRTGLTLAILTPERTPQHITQVVDWLVESGNAI
jgi:hypothetical protein